MSLRLGMIDLISRLRTMTNSGTATTSTPYFTDTQLQDVLDGHVTYIRDELLNWLPETNTAGVAVYHDAKTSWRDLEGTASGTTCWAVKTGPGAVQSSGYTPNYISGMIRFTVDQGGTAYYLTARSYDLMAAAADVFMQRAAYFSDWYQFSGDGQQFYRQQAYKQATEMIEFYRKRSGQNRQRGGLQTSKFVRTDLNRSNS